MKPLARWLMAVSLWACGLVAQDAQVSGRTQHASGNAIDQAAVALMNEDTGVRRVARSNSDGYYTLSGANPGVYRITVRKPGFQTITRMEIKLEVGQSARIDFLVELETMKSTVSVEGKSYFLANEDSSVGTVVVREFLQTLPLNGRGLLGLLEAAPGVVITPASGVDAGQFSVNGQRAGSNYILVDGVSVNAGAVFTQSRQSIAGTMPPFTVIGSMHNLVSLEGLEEFRLQTSSSNGQFGRMPGGQLLLSTRSGTNQFHGTLFSYLRNEKLNANDWFANSHGAARSPVRINGFGGVAGGPLRRQER